MPIWFNPDITADQLRPLARNTMLEHIGIELIEIGDNYLKAKMPVDHRTRQPYGLLHGGASAVLAETLGSVASSLIIDLSRFSCVGLEINANHVRAVREGHVYGTAYPLHLGGATHIWDIRIYDEKEKLVCVSRLTVAIISKEKQQ
ncbi:MAG: hotdog fold thioesterase [Bacteroidetes bacterium]|nr:hotdog fold thioesterase [Bacteroidota bacterium]